MSLVDEYVQAQQACGIEEGDRVKVLRKPTDDDPYWPDIWLPEFMDALVGEVGEVILESRIGFHVDIDSDPFGAWSFPYFVLEKIND